MNDVLNVVAPEGQLVDILADELADLRGTKTAFLHNEKEREGKDPTPKDHAETAKDVGPEDFNDLKKILLSADVGYVGKEDARA